LTTVNVRGVGHAIIELGGGRHRVGEALDLSVGFTDIASIGTLLDDDTPLAIVHAASEADAEQAEALLLAACTTGNDAPELAPVISEIVTGNA
jgi:thymidine phosphorylase